MAASATMLAWGVVEYRDGYEDAGQLDDALDNLRWATDYFMRAHTAPNELYGQIGKGGADHAWWGPAEVMPMARPSYRITPPAPAPTWPARPPRRWRRPPSCSGPRTPRTPTRC